MKRSHRLWGVGLLSIFLVGCQFDPQAWLASLEQPDPGGILFIDDFSHRTNQWALEVNPSGVVHYDQETMRILISQPFSEYWTTPGLDQKNIIVEVIAEKVNGPDNNAYGLVCRMRNAKNYYAFLISNDGYYAIIKNLEGVRHVLSSDSFEPHPAIRVSGLNHLHAECVDDTLRLVINWQDVIEVKDQDLRTGDAGLIAATLEYGGTDIRFDNFLATVP